MSSVPRRRAWICIRESKEELLRGYSPDEMVSQCRAKAEQLGAEVVRVMVEAGKRDEFDCPGLLEAILAAEAGEYDLLISYDMYRLSGELPKHMWLKEQIEKTAVTIHYVTMEFPPGPHGELMETIQGGIGRYERMLTRMRTQNGITGKLKRQEPICNGRAPYGLEKVYGKNKKPIGYAPTKQMATLERIVRELQHRTLLAVCDGLNAEGIPTPSGTGRWESGTITSLLSNATYTGTYRWGKTKQIHGRRADGKRTYTKEIRPDEDLVTFPIATFLDPAEVTAARVAMRRRRHDRRSRRPADDDPFTLRGIVRCGHCHGMLSCTVNNGYRRYTCLRAYGPGVAADERCPLPQIAAGDLETLAWGAVKRALGRACLREDLDAACRGDGAAERHSSQVASVKKQLAHWDRRIANANDALLDAEPGSFTMADLKVKRRDAERAREECLASLGMLERTAPRVLSEDDALAIWRAYEQLKAGMLEDAETAQGQRRWLGQFATQGTVRLAAPGEPGAIILGRKHAYVVGWEARAILSNDLGHPQGSLLLLDSHADRPRLQIVA
jgi:site-specific DNA recombinase